VDKLWKALRGQRLTIFNVKQFPAIYIFDLLLITFHQLLGKVGESHWEIRDNRKKLRLVAELKVEISLLEKQHRTAVKERSDLREEISRLEEAAVSNDNSMQLEIDNWKEQYHLKVDECTALRGKLMAHGATIRALGMAVCIHTVHFNSY
jgi:hypothetical protein